MAEDTQTVLCGSCKCAVKTVANPKSDDKVSCPQCGRSDRFDNVMDSVRGYVGQLAADHLAGALGKATRNSRFVKMTVKKSPQRSFNWICSEVRF